MYVTRNWLCLLSMNCAAPLWRLNIALSTISKELFPYTRYFFIRTVYKDNEAQICPKI